MGSENEKEKVFVTGANGLLGSMVCRYLIDAGYTVTGVRSTKNNTNNLQDLPMNIIYGDVRDRHFLNREIPGHDLVVHAAALTSLWPSRSKAIWEVNFTGTQNVLEASVTAGVKRFIHVGSASSFKPGPPDDPGTENKPYEPGVYQTDYNDSKFKAQEYLLEFHKQNGYPIVIINPTFMIGPYDHIPTSGKIIVDLYKRNVPGYTRGGRNFVYTGDVADAIVRSIQSGRPGECYLVGNENLSFKAFFKQAHEVFNRPFRMVKIPLVLVYGLGMVNSVLARLFRYNPGITFRISRVAGELHFYNTEKARKELNHKRTPVKKAIHESIEWFKENDMV